MNKNSIRKMLMLLACIVTIALSGMSASAAVYRTTTAKINLRSSAGSTSSSTIIGTIPKGATIQLIGKSTKYSNWFYVEYDGKQGFVEGTNLKSTSSSSSDDSESSSSGSSYTRYVTVNLNLRSSAKITSSNIITTLAKGTKVTVLGKSGDSWYYVQTPSGQKGYVAAGYFTTSSSSSSSSSGTTKTTTVAVNLRSSAKVTDGNIILTVPAGRTVTVLSSSGNWYKVRYNGKTGYMKSGYFTDETTSSSYVTEKTSANLRLRSTTSTSSSSNIITTIPKGASVKVYKEVAGGWYYVSYGSKKGYVKAGYFASDSSSSSSSGRSGKTTANVRLRSSTSTSSSSNIILVIPSGRTVTILGTSGNWYKVRYNGQTGYVSSDYVS
jgi:uncharacterized protein YgiM (DUF1202 family)